MGPQTLSPAPHLPTATGVHSPGSPYRYHSGDRDSSSRNLASCPPLFLHRRVEYRPQVGPHSLCVPRDGDCLAGNFSLGDFLASRRGASLEAQIVESACNAGDLSLIPGLGRSPGKRKCYPLQYSGLENSMDYTDHGVSKSQTRLSDFRFRPHI